MKRAMSAALGRLSLTVSPVPVVGLLAVAAAAASFAGGTGTARQTAQRAASRPLLGTPTLIKTATQPRPTSQCLVVYGIHCYSPAQFENAYDLAGLHAAGIDGSGQTIAIVDSFGSPTIAADLHQFDQTFGVSNPWGVPVDPAIATDPNLTIIAPAGAIPPFDPSNGDMVGWAQETTLDVEWAHVIAPKANILLVETPVSETEGVTGFPEIVTAENYVIDHHLANVISQSFGATEETFPNAQALLNLRSAFQNAQQNNVTVLGASGDLGSTDYQSNLQDLYTMQVNSWPSSDPLVTSVGGTQMNLDDSGNRLSPDVVWNDGYGASGGGPSAVFNRPNFQNHVQSVVGNTRGTPDISMNAAVDGGVWVYYTFVNPGSPYHIFGGTSASTPEFSGIVAMADQVAGQALGDINQPLYNLGPGSGIVDVTSGNNDIGSFVNSDGNTYHVPGFNALPGYDMASGLGTIDGGKFVLALANAAASGGGGDVTCTSSLSYASVRGNVKVPKGATCSISNSVVRGNVEADQAASLTVGNSTVGGNLQIHNEPAGGAANVLCGDTVSGNLEVHNNAVETIIGVGGSCSAGNWIGGNAQVHNNSVSGSPVAVIVGNTIGHNLDCHNDTLPPTGGGNTVGGNKSGECAGF
jgi:subtilase family serine protease